MKQLWAPWRMDYIRSEKRRGCFLCRILKRVADEEDLVVHRGRHVYVVMNRFPYNSGHLMVAPNRHCSDFDQLNDSELEEIFRLLKVSTSVLKATFNPHGFNIGANLGKAGGAGEEHLHLHVVPRWIGDTNFMPVLSETKVIPQYLIETYHKLHSAFQNYLKKEAYPKKGG